jgi:hypothetical protein
VTYSKRSANQTFCGGSVSRNDPPQAAIAADIEGYALAITPSTENQARAGATPWAIASARLTDVAAKMAARVRLTWSVLVALPSVLIILRKGFCALRLRSVATAGLAGIVFAIETEWRAGARIGTLDHGHGTDGNQKAKNYELPHDSNPIRP